jgi:hypothetical protein
MKKIVFLVCGFLMLTQLIAQKTVNDYSYVVVPDQYDFTQGRDAFQINSMTNYMFNKYGFNSYMVSEVPNVKRCDGLFADVEKGKGFVGTKLSVVLKDCNGAEVYRSPEGKSKEKDFKQGYQDALRKAFEYVATENFTQTEMVIYEEVSSEVTLPEAKTTPKVIEVEVKKSEITEVDDSKTIKTKVEVTKAMESADEVKTVIVTKTATNEKEVAAVTPPRTTATTLMPSARFSSYSLGASTFLLRKTTIGYSLYEETADAGDGLLLIGTLTASNNRVTFTDTLGNNAEAYFDETKNLVITQDGKSHLYKLTN